MSVYADRYDLLRDRVDRTMENLNAAQQAARHYSRGASSPLRPGIRNSQSPPVNRIDQQDPYAPPTDTYQRRPTANTTSVFLATEQRVPRSPLRSSGGIIPAYAQTAFKPETSPRSLFIEREPFPVRQQPSYSDEMLFKIETLQRERDSYKNEAELEKSKNVELEKEFHVLRDLIAHQAKPIGHDDNMMLRDQYHTERQLRIACEADVARLRQQLADSLSGGHRDTLNLKKALSDMQQINHQNLATIYEKGDQNLAQMEQLEDLSKIIRERDSEVDNLKQQILDLQAQNRQLHQDMTEVKRECAELTSIRGIDMLNKSNQQKPLEDPRFKNM